MSDFVRTLLRGGGIVLAAAVLGAVAAYAYSKEQTPQFESTATVLARPSGLSTSGDEDLNTLSQLSYGSLGGDVLALARSPALFQKAASGIGLDRAPTQGYTLHGSMLPLSSVFVISVDGPEAGTAASLANAVAGTVSSVVAKDFPVLRVSTVDGASLGVKVRPKTKRNVLAGALGGLLIGLVATVAVRRVRERDDEFPSLSPLERELARR